MRIERVTVERRSAFAPGCSLVLALAIFATLPRKRWQRGERVKSSQGMKSGLGCAETGAELGQIVSPAWHGIFRDRLLKTYHLLASVTDTLAQVYGHHTPLKIDVFSFVVCARQEQRSLK